MNLRVTEEVISFFLRAVEDCRLLWSPSLYLLAVLGVHLECQAKGCAVLVFDLADAVKALVQFERSSDASQEATAHLVQVTVVEEAFLAPCLCWLVG
jgi:hypothetical protein